MHQSFVYRGPLYYSDVLLKDKPEWSTSQLCVHVDVDPWVYCDKKERDEIANTTQWMKYASICGQSHKRCEVVQTFVFSFLDGKRSYATDSCALAGSSKGTNSNSSFADELWRIHKNSFECGFNVQGLLNFSDNIEEDGGLCLVIPNPPHNVRVSVLQGTQAF